MVKSCLQTNWLLDAMQEQIWTISKYKMLIKEAKNGKETWNIVIEESCYIEEGGEFIFKEYVRW